MFSIKNNVYDELIIKKSKFISFLYKVDSIDSVKLYLSELSNKYSDATHICYAYIIDNVKRFSDDGEPSKTAGMPILNVLESKNLNHVLLCVVRYFGGIKLGANGLVRAYSQSSKDVVNKSEIVSLISGITVQICFLYEKTKLIENLLKNCNIVFKDYSDYVTYKFTISLEDFNVIGDELVNNSISLDKLDMCYIEKEF